MDDDAATTSVAAFAVESALPKGYVFVCTPLNMAVWSANLENSWGQTSNRTAFYRVPLIVVASVVLALGLVVAIILYVFFAFALLLAIPW